MTRKIAIITGGGDCPGINAFIAAVVRRGVTHHAAEFVGLRKAFEGAAAGNIEDYLVPLGPEEVKGLENTPSTILESSRFNPFSDENRQKGYPGRIMQNFKRLGIEGIVGTGGNDTLLSALRMSGEGIPVVMAPKSIDNDVSGTDVMLGFKTAVAFGATAARSTADSARAHRRISLVEVMGREAGWLAMEIGIASGAEIILIPERPVDLRDLCGEIERIYREHPFVNIIVAEGTRFSPGDPLLLQAREESQVVRALLDESREKDTFGNLKLGGISQILRRVLRLKLGLKKLEEIRTTDLGFTLRGLPPLADDIILGVRFGVKAIDLLFSGHTGVMVGLQGLEVRAVPIKDALKPKKVEWEDDELRSLGVFVSTGIYASPPATGS